MNLIEARKLGHEGWVRSPTRTNGIWIRFDETGYSTKEGGQHGAATAFDLDAEDWEPRPEPLSPFEIYIWLHTSGIWMTQVKKSDSADGWRRIRVREVT